MPATMKLVLSPGTMGSGEVFCHDRFGPCLANWTYIEAPVEGGALYRATKGLAIGLTTAVSPVTRVWAVYVAVATSLLAAPNLVLTTTFISYVPSFMGFHLK